MRKKKNGTWRAAALLLVLTLITSCFVGGTFAKYTTSDSASDTARVAKWGVTINANTDLFAESYKDTAVTDNTATVKVETTGTKLVAPGTEGTGLGIKNSATKEPEVSYTMTIKLNADTAKVPTLNYTPKNGTATNYEPVKFSVYNGDTMLKDKISFADLKALFNGTKVIYKYDVATKKYYLDKNCDGSIDDTEKTDALAVSPEIKIKWEWAFEAAETERELCDKLDTILGDMAAGETSFSDLPDDIGTVDATKSNIEVKLDWTATASQIN